MILVDTHVWVWWVHNDPLLWEMKANLQSREKEGLAVSAISCWEVSKLVERGRLALPRKIDEWLGMALEDSGLSLIPLSPAIAAASTMLPGSFLRDPADPDHRGNGATPRFALGNPRRENPSVSARPLA